jgi:TonB family protein
LLILVFFTLWHRPLVLVTRTVEIEFADIDEVRAAERLGERRPQKPATGIQKVREFLEQTRNIIPFLSQEDQPEKSGPSVAKPDRSREELAQENRRKLEEELDRTAEPAKTVTGAARKGSGNLLNPADAERAKSAASGASGTPKTGSQSPSAENADAGVAAKLVLNDSGRKVLYEPPPPAYPEWALRDRVQGKVTLKVWFDKEGFPLATEVVQSSGNSLLDATAKNQALKFRIEPILDDREDWGTFVINFIL